MSDGYVVIEDDLTGKKIDNEELTVGGQTVMRQRVVVYGWDGSGAAFGILPLNDGATAVLVEGAVSVSGQVTVSLDPANATSAAYEASRVVKASAGRVWGLSGYNSKTTGQFIQLHDTTSVPSNGVAPVFVLYVPPLSNFSVEFGRYGRIFSTGITICNSTTGPTKTLGSSDCWFDVQYT